MEKVPMTTQGEQALREELENLKLVERPRIVKEITEARTQGDLRENAEYQYAKEEQGFIEGRLAKIEAKLANAQVIDVNTIAPSDKVIFGATVQLMKLENDAEVTYQIVGDDEADIKSNKISVYSPIARALIGKTEGDTVVVKAPGGDSEYEICEVRYL